MVNDARVATSVQDRMTFRDYLGVAIALFKLRVVSLLLLASIGGAFLGAGGIPSIGALITLAITGTLAAGGASAINQYLERESDGNAKRTAGRPLPQGTIKQPQAVLYLALAMIAVAVLAVLPGNPAMALYLALGAAIYVGVYTIWLKPRSVLNIVIGGAAGSCAVMTGGAAVGAASDPGVIALALLVFLWTPSHFWALAMFYKEDYASVEVPMLPVQATAQHTAWWIFVHTASTVLAGIVLAVHPALGLPYFLPVAAMSALFLIRSANLIATPERKQAIRLFVVSNLFLALILLTIMVVTTGRQLIS